MNAVTSGLLIAAAPAGRFGQTKPWGFHPADRSGALFKGPTHNQEHERTVPAYKYLDCTGQVSVQDSRVKPPSVSRLDSARRTGAGVTHVITFCVI